MNLKFLILIICTLIACIHVCYAGNTLNQNMDSYLVKPTGQYNVTFKDYHWINKNICPDPNFNGHNQDDFSPDNKSFCRELMLRIY